MTVCQLSFDIFCWLLPEKLSSTSWYNSVLIHPGNIKWIITILLCSACIFYSFVFYLLRKKCRVHEILTIIIVAFASRLNDDWIQNEVTQFLINTSFHNMVSFSTKEKSWKAWLLDFETIWNDILQVLLKYGIRNHMNTFLLTMELSILIWQGEGVQSYCNEQASYIFLQGLYSLHLCRIT